VPGQCHETPKLVAQVTREVGRVAAAKGIHIGLDLARHAVAVARATAGNRSSMLQDLDAGHATEIEALCGAVVSEARRARVPVPVNARLAHRVRALERLVPGRGAPPPAPPTPPEPTP